MASNFKFSLVGITFIAVISDSMLIPFYPQYFDDQFGISDSFYVGQYLAAYCLTVMLAFPLWARVAKYIQTLRLLVYTQLLAGLLSLICYTIESTWVFWLLSLLMMVFKASYLLIYPLIMSMEEKSNHASTIGILSVIVNFGAILGALLGGVVLQLFESRLAFLIMAAGDFLQMGVCFFLLNNNQDDFLDNSTNTDRQGAIGFCLLARLSLIMLLFYLSAYLIYHFFVRYWQMVSDHDGEIISGMVFSIPAFMALIGLWLNQRRKLVLSGFSGLRGNLLIGVFGLLLQASEVESLIIIGRMFFGWALFQSAVRLDMLIFHFSKPDAYAMDFSKLRFFQSLGVLIAAYAAGSLATLIDLQGLFNLAAIGFVLTLILYSVFLSTERKSAKAVFLMGETRTGD